MIIYEIIFTKQAADFVESLDKGYKNKIRGVFERLKENPFSYPYRKIRGEQDLYRIRIGRYRILYKVDQPESRIIILKVDTRNRVYKRLERD
ncbi:MAG: type II toxin-antitoxin system RelE/ParE family toxin [Methanosarcinales archaeon Met12]|nr:MAG: type II toxin-antitoxin system RelE/ParE family toxin [Methanosarcinales archaeon Met12]